MNTFRINNMSNVGNMNNVDEFISNQGFMSERTKSPRRVIPNMAHNQYFQANEQYANVNRINSNRDVSPNKMIAKSKPLLGNNFANNGRIQPIQSHFHNNQQASFAESQNRYGYDVKPSQPANNWKNIKSPRSPQDNQFFNNPNSNQPKKCSNHPSKKAEYMAETEGEYLYYCESCAAKLAANNFEVIKLPVSGINNQHNQPQKAKMTYQRRQIPCIPEYKGNPIYQSIIEFLKEVFTVEQEHHEGYQQLEKIDENYEQQIEMVNEFYRQLEDILTKMHQDHIADIEKEHRKHSQMKDIYMSDLYDNLSMINEIVNDLEVSFQTVVTQIRKEDIQHFNNALDQNRIQIRFFNNKVEEQKEMLKEVISYKEERLSEMVGEFQKCLTTLWDEPEEVKPEKYNFQNTAQNKQTINPPMRQKHPVNNQQKNMVFNMPGMSDKILQPNNRQTSKVNDQKFNVMRIHQNSQNSGLAREFEGKGACRTIFQDDDDDENQLQQQVSPNFKKI